MKSLIMKEYEVQRMLFWSDGATGGVAFVGDSGN